MWPSNPTLRYACPRAVKTYVYTKICTWMLIALFIIAKKWGTKRSISSWKCDLSIRWHIRICNGVFITGQEKEMKCTGTCHDGGRPSQGSPKTIGKHMFSMVLGTETPLLYPSPGGSVHMHIHPHTSTQRDDIIEPTPSHTPCTNTGVCDRVGAIMYLCGPVTRVGSSCCVESSSIGGSKVPGQLVGHSRDSTHWLQE